MNLVFLTQNRFTDIEMHNIYSDLLQQFIREGHHPYIVTPRERATGEQTQLVDCGSYHLLKVCVGNISSHSLIERGIATLGMQSRFQRAVKKHLSGVSFDLILYSTPPITFSGLIRYLKRKNHARTYLMLKDIFPQNAVDLQMFGKHSPIYRYFRAKEKRLYRISDAIGCMSQANVQYLLAQNPYLQSKPINVCPNSLAPLPLADEDRIQCRKKFGLPTDRMIFLYGGNLGKPQGIDFMLECLARCADLKNAFFFVAGNGSEYDRVAEYCRTSGQENLLLVHELPRVTYERAVRCCDVGLIFLDHRFTIPNMPSRVLSYMQEGLAVLSATDSATDLPQEIERGGFGWACRSNDAEAFRRIVCSCCDNPAAVRTAGARAYQYLTENYTVAKTYQAVMNDACAQVTERTEERIP